ncbi:unnamed protein product [Lactuca saligna]|uniref:Phosphofructokinase domain-containing protein n=1 Tax=Lactuca saligna TaxID=75948 RepID=A0AA35YV59_LACSI|nr:unnamed protein product [Lactuca saligna]
MRTWMKSHLLHPPVRLHGIVDFLQFDVSLNLGSMNLVVSRFKMCRFLIVSTVATARKSKLAETIVLGLLLDSKVSILSKRARWSFEFIQHRPKENGHVVIVLAEGVDQEYVSESVNAVEEREMHLEINCLLILVNDPTYIIWAIPSNAYDNIYCTLLAQSAIHGAMAGFSGFTVGPINNRHAYIPIQALSALQFLLNKVWNLQEGPL